MLGLFDRLKLGDDDTCASIKGKADGRVVVAGNSTSTSVAGTSKTPLLGTDLTKGIVRPPLMNINSWTIWGC